MENLQKRITRKSEAKKISNKHKLYGVFYLLLLLKGEELEVWISLYICCIHYCAQSLNTAMS